MSCGICQLHGARVSQRVERDCASGNQFAFCSKREQASSPLVESFSMAPRSAMECLDIAKAFSHFNRTTTCFYASTKIERWREADETKRHHQKKPSSRVRFLNSPDQQQQKLKNSKKQPLLRPRQPPPPTPRSPPSSRDERSPKPPPPPPPPPRPREPSPPGAASWPCRASRPSTSRPGLGPASGPRRSAATTRAARSCATLSTRAAPATARSWRWPASEAGTGPSSHRRCGRS